MNIHIYDGYPTRPVEALSRGAEIASRFGGIAAFSLCLLGLVYAVAL
jgi:hypothetical protein